MAVNLAYVKPFEICSIRPPTENYSLTFRLTRNCYWRHCAFCPVYKFGARFSKRPIEDVKEDIRSAKLIDDLLFQEGLGGGFRDGDAYERLARVLDRIRRAKGPLTLSEEEPKEEIPEDLDPRLRWFLSWFKDKPRLEDSLNHVLSWRLGGARTCFMGDADSLILKPQFITEAIDHIKGHFPSIQRFTVYGRTRTAARVRTLEELRAFHNAGLDRVHFGLESGSDAVLKFMRKGVTREEHIEGGLKVTESGLSCSVYVMPGLGGVNWSEAHARDTADVITQISPDYVRIRSLQIFPQTPLEKAVKRGEFTEASEEQVVKEIRILLETIDTETEIVSDSASNLLSINGRLPQHREAMLKEIDAYLVLPDREKRLFSLKSRLQSFLGQYGGLTEDIAHALNPFFQKGRLDVSRASGSEVEKITSLIRSKLMP
jgi:radical SAM superfamily enzyme YgiQ (UPF0313 family)